MNQSQSFYLLSLGCPKNLVDSEGIATLLRRAGYAPAPSPEAADLLIVNTCGFIESAREESREILRELARTKQPGQRIIAAGCYSQRCPNELIEAIPSIDGLIGTRRWMDIVDLIEQLEDEVEHRPPPNPICHVPDVERMGQDTRGIVRAAIQGGSAYLKIAEGCRRACAFCAIPLIKGPTVSRPPDAILTDARQLAEYGVKEIILIAQDITDYGHDLQIEDGLEKLLEQLLTAVPDIPWIRLMYTFPGYVTESLIQLMASEPQILPYLDMPLQHADQRILRSMRRPNDITSVRQTLANIRRKVPQVALRTTFIVGYPGEDETAYQNLIHFVQAVQFDHVGVFSYSFEPGTPAEHLGNPIPGQVKTERIEHLMAVQAEISLDRNQKFIGKTLDVLIEGVDQENQISIGRSYRDAPEIDGLVLIEDAAPIGEMVRVKINSAITHDLVGRLVS